MQGAPITFTAAQNADVVISGGTNGFLLSSLSWIVIDGFTISDTTGVGVYAKTSTNITISNNHITRCGKPIDGQTAMGVYLRNTSNSVVSGNRVDYNSDSGIYLAYDATANQIVGNITSHNAREYTRKAAGIDIRAIGGNIIRATSATETRIPAFKSARMQSIISLSIMSAT
jgi:parallel beta-helix repeat protein